MIYRPLLATYCVTIFLATSLADEPLETDAVDRDYSAELVRTPATSPQDSLEKSQVADGFRIELVAAEPLISDPVAIAFDELGRMFVVQMNGYSEDGDDNLGVIRRLEDTDRDGVYDRGTNFVTGLSWPTAVACMNGGILVGAAPDIIFCKDADGDGVAEQRRTVFTGFGRQNVQGLLNSFVWGLDNQLYGSSSSNGGTIRQLDHPGSTAVTLRRRDFVIDPSSFTLQGVGGGGQHGMSFDRWGNRFVSSNSNHLQWVEYPERYLRRNPHLRAPAATRNIAEDGPAAEVFRSSPVEPWREVRTRLRVKGMVGGPIEGGGRAAGYFTGATGATIYRGDAFPDTHADGTFAVVGDVGGNLIHLKLIEDDGLAKTARRVEAESEFVSSTDNWFRPVQFANGPDGAIYVIDMYREVIEHPLSLPPMIKRHLDLTSGRQHGRIYRIVPDDFRQPTRPLPGEVPETELVAMLAHPNGWHRETAARLIVAGGRSDAETGRRFCEMLAKLLETAESPDARIRALYCLDSLRRLETPSLLRGLRDPHPQVRIHALQLAEEETHESETEVIRQLQSMAEDDQLTVRYQLALTLGEFKWADRFETLLKLARSDAKHKKMRFAILSSIDGGQLALAQALIDDNVVSQPGATVLLQEVVRELGAAKRDIAAVLRTLRGSSLPNSQNLIAVLLESTGKRSADLVRFLEDSGVNNAQQIVQQMIEHALGIAQRGDTIEQRSAAIRFLQLAEFDAASETICSLLDPTQASQLRATALQTLEKFADSRAADMLLETLPSFGLEDKSRALDMLVSRDTWAIALLARITDNKIRSETISARHRQRLLQSRNQMISERAKETFAINDARDEVLKRYQSVLGMRGDAGRGKTLFNKTCAVCHRLNEVGNQVAPDLEPLRKRGASFLLTNILDPNRELDARYESYTVATQDGLSYAGIIASTTPEAVVINDANGRKSSIARRDIDSMVASGKSLMPEGLESELDLTSMADLISYILQD